MQKTHPYYKYPYRPFKKNNFLYLLANMLPLLESILTEFQHFRTFANGFKTKRLEFLEIFIFSICKLNKKGLKLFSKIRSQKIVLNLVSKYIYNKNIKLNLSAKIRCSLILAQDLSMYNFLGPIF